MGGCPPLGYDVIDHKLVVNGAEADLVRHIFRRFRDLGSATKLVEELAVAGHTTKSWTTQDGKARRGKAIDKTFVYKALHNRVYLGEAVHKGAAHPGEHDAIIDRPTWDRVHAILAENAHARANHTRRRGRLYRYYVCLTVIKRKAEACPVRSVAASEAEALVLAQTRAVFRAPEIAARTARAAADDATEAIPERDVIAALASLDTLWDQLFPAEQNRLLHLLIDRIDVAPDGFHLRLRAEGLRGLVDELRTTPAEAA